MSDVLVDVIVNIDAKNVDRPFQYRLPAQLQSEVVPGRRVIVEFGRRKVEGLVLSYSDQQLVPEVKPVIKVAGSEPPLPADLLSLVRWLKTERGCRWVDAVRTVAGPGLFSSRSARVRVSNDGDQEQLTADERHVLQLVQKRRSMTIARLGREVGDARAVMKLLDRGLLQRTRPRKAVQAKTVNVYHAVGSVDDLSRGARRQREVLAVLGAGPATIDQIAERLTCDRSVVSRAVRELTKKQLIAVTKRQVQRRIAVPGVRPVARHQSTPEQQQAADQIRAAIDGSGGRFLLYGVTASGKTEVYLQAIEHALKRGRSAFYLVPEIGLTPQLIDVIVSRIGQEQLSVLHSGLSPAQRYEQWLRLAEGQAVLAIGARSAVFAPTAADLIIVDEEHDSSYKQGDAPRYHARDVAEQRARGGVLVLGSATPSVETFWRARSGDLELLRLDSRIGGRELPEIELVDMREELAAGNRSMFSRALLSALTEAVEQGEQAVVFVNRRGYSPFVLCRDCGFVVRCSQCDVSMVLYAGKREMRCHYCDRRQPPPEQCGRCGGVRIKQFGVGTEQVETELKTMFPDATVIRMDTDTTRNRGAHTDLWSRFARGEAQIMVGTQMVTKGFDVPGVTVVGAIAADLGLHYPDFRASERTFQLLTQVVGRSGRGQKMGRGFIQTYSPEHYAIVAAARQDYEGFYEKEIAVRQQLDFPPFSQLVMVVLSGRDETRVSDVGRRIVRVVSEQAAGEVLGPAPAPIRRIRGEYRWQVLVICRTGDKQGRTLEVIAGIEPDDAVAVSVDVDPVAML